MLKQFLLAALLAGTSVVATAQEMPKNKPPTGISRVAYTLQPVNDLERAVSFYTKGLGMQVTRTFEAPGGNFREINLAFDDKPASSAIILAHTKGKPVDTKGQ